MMRAIRKPRPEAGFELSTIDIPAYGAREVLIRVSLASICGTDVHITEWDEWSASRIKPPMTYGHEFCGVVHAIGDQVSSVKVGDYVAAEMHIACGLCYQCRTGSPHICQYVKIAGVDAEGCFAEFVTLPETQLIKLPDSIPPEVGACLDSLGNAVHSVSKANVSGKTVLITGCGAIGLFSIAVAKALGATRVYASEVGDYRIQLAEKAGATKVFNPAKGDDIVNEIKAENEGRGVDVLLEMSGHPVAITTGFEALDFGGTAVLLGLPHGPVSLDLANAIIFKEAKVLGVTGRLMFDTWYLMLDLLTSGRIDISWIITHRLKMSDFETAIALVSGGQSGKIILDPSA
jgi:threonine 3-dehydrogenase